MLTQRHYAHAAWTVLEQLRQKHGVTIRHVLVTTDERDQEWLYVHSPLWYQPMRQKH